MPADQSTTLPATAPETLPIEEQPKNQTEVYAVYGADPEVLAYAMAKYSRSALSMKESLHEISSQRAEQFLNTFYFQYGHRSIADLAHIAFAVERLSLLAAITLVDEQRWDGQERSTRYQSFKKSGWYLPDFAGEVEKTRVFTREIDALFRTYHHVSEQVFASLCRSVERPASMRVEAYERTLRARAFDVARYLLPLATNTSLGQIVNARTLETQISRLLTDEHAEIRELGEKLRGAAAGVAWNVNESALAELFHEISEVSAGAAEKAKERFLRDVKVAPTLVKYAAENAYLKQSRAELREAAAAIMGDAKIDEVPRVDLVETKESLEAEVAATLLYGVTHFPYRQIRDHVAGMPAAQIAELIDIGVRHRGTHDELLRQFSAGQALRFDILMDIGGFRDMHRHRKCTQILQSFTAEHGYEDPQGLVAAGTLSEYRAAMDKAHDIFRHLSSARTESALANARYILPLGTRCRSLFKMDFAEALYIAELRSAVQGHFSYRNVAWEMYRAVEQQHPQLAKYIRVTDVREPVDFLKR